MKNEEEKNRIKELSNKILQVIEQFKLYNTSEHPYDIAELFIDLREYDNEEYYSLLKKLPHELFAEILAEFPEFIQEEIYQFLSIKKIADIASKMDTDDAADFIQNVSEDDNQIAQDIIQNFALGDQELINKLIAYDDHEAGAYMQTELLHANVNEEIGIAIARLKQLKEIGELDNIWHCHIVDNNNKYLGSVGLEDLIIFERDVKFCDIAKEKYKFYSVLHTSNIKEVIEMVTNYNLTAVAVLDDNNTLLGRITSDDIYDIIEESATEQIYNMAGVSDDVENEENIYQIGKNRAIWLGLNLVTAIIASLVIGIFDSTIQSLVALAVLMPIVASMGGNAGTQTLTVTVRQIAIGDITIEDAKKTIKKEVIISLVNGFLFACVIGVISYIWFEIPMLGVVIAMSMIINLISAGFFGAFIPLALQKAKIDPAIGSTVLLTTVTDIIGFFSFLGLASLILL